MDLNSFRVKDKPVIPNLIDVTTDASSQFAVRGSQLRESVATSSGNGIMASQQDAPFATIPEPTKLTSEEILLIMQFSTYFPGFSPEWELFRIF